MNQSSTRSPAWNWSVCVVLLFATLLMYMDRMTVTQLAGEIVREFGLTEEQYGLMDMYFSLAFAFGALLTGFLADWCNLWWLYPTAVFVWSLAGAATGLVPAGLFPLLLVCRFWLGLAEAGHWPCALITTQRLFPPHQRTLANSILQSGAAVGAILTPLIILLLMFAFGNWRLPFVIIGSFGVAWIAIWFLLVRPGDLTNSVDRPFAGFWIEFLKPLLLDRRFYILVVFAICINNAWHFFRVWLARLLEKTYFFSQNEIQWFSSAYYFAADIGSLTIGFTSLWLVRIGLSVHASRMAVLTVCALIATQSLFLTTLPRGPLAYGILLLFGFAALGLFPPYYSLVQEITSKHQGKVTGLMGCLIWLAMAPQRWLEGYVADQMKNYNFGLILAGISPMIGVALLYVAWPRAKAPAIPSPETASP